MPLFQKTDKGAYNKSELIPVMIENYKKVRISMHRFIFYSFPGWVFILVSGLLISLLFTFLIKVDPLISIIVTTMTVLFGMLLLPFVLVYSTFNKAKKNPELGYRRYGIYENV